MAVYIQSAAERWVIIKILIPIISSIFFRLGGDGRKKFLFIFNAKLWRWIGLGYFIGAWFHNWILVLTYFLATWASGYGENHLFRKWFGRERSCIIYGFLFGCASIPCLGWLGLVQGVIGLVVFWYLMKLSNDGIGYLTDGTHKLEKTWKLDHKWVELGIGFFGTILYVFK